MIPRQRRAHRVFWLVVAPLLLAGAIALHLAAPDQPAPEPPAKEARR